MNTSRLLWHGTPDVADPSALRPHVSFLDAVWLSGSPEVAALYAGPDGHVHGFLPAPGTRMLAAFGEHSAEADRYPSPDDWLAIRSWLEGNGFDLAYFDCLGDDAVSGPHGQPCWSALFHDLSEVNGAGEDLLRLCGLAGLMHHERIELALGDRSRRIDGSHDPAYKRLAARLATRAKEPSVSVAVLDPAVLVHACSLPSATVSSAWLSGHPLPATRPEHLAPWHAVPDTSLLPAPVPAFGT